MTRRTPLPDPFDSKAFAVREARAASLTPERLRGGDIVAPFHGVRTTASIETVLDLCRAYLPRMSERQFFSHSTAAVICGMPVAATLERDRTLHVTARPPAHPPRTHGVSGHRATVEARTYRGLPVADPVITWVQLASVLSIDELVIAGDFLVRRKQPLATLEQLHGVAASAAGRGIRAVRTAIGRVRAGTDSPMETRLRLALVAAGLPEPVIGYAVTDEAGFVATPDLSYIAQRIAIEYEGEPHWTDCRVFAEDIERRERLEDAGWQVIRVISEHLGVRTPLLVRRVQAALEGRARPAR